MSYQSSISNSDAPCVYQMKKEIYGEASNECAGKLCSIIIDGGNNVNVASLRLVEKLKLPTLHILNHTSCNG
ncbi:hypothetical protein CR513_40038, partial [Mucuna pruriens]